MRMRCLLPGLLCVVCCGGPDASAGDLEQQLQQESAAELAAAAREEGDPRRGAILFHQPHMACAKCHATGGGDETLGPDLTRLGEEATDAHLVESVLFPSKTIRKGYESITVLTADGRTVTGLVVEDTDEALVLRDVSGDGRRITFAPADIAERVANETSVMPAGQVNQLGGRQQFLDLISYLIEIRDGGPARARDLRPPASAIVLEVPEYEQHVDHAGLIAQLDDDAYERGEAIYNRLCVNCHGTHDRPGTLPTAPRFAEGRFKNGSDPLSMYRTLTYGFGLMVPQTWMVPRQKYDVIHYIRAAYLREHNPSQLVMVDEDYLASLPAGDTFGPEPVTLEPWVTMDYGPSLINTYEVGSDGSNFAYKGIAVRLDSGPGGVSRGEAWMIFDHDTLRVAAAWTGEGFIDWRGIHFDGRHGAHPRIVGEVHFANPTGPGWANPATGDFDDDLRVRGRDGRMYGPLPWEWGRFEGLYHHDQQVIIAYTVDGTRILETPGLATAAGSTLFTRTFNTGPRARDLIVQVARHPTEGASLRAVEAAADADMVLFGPPTSDGDDGDVPRFAFDGGTRAEVADAHAFDMSEQDYTITARIRTRRDGTIFAKTDPGEEWVPDGKALFVREGRLCFDIGWVGVVVSQRPVDDGEWHDVALTWDHTTATARLYIDGQPDASHRLRPGERLENSVVRIGYCAPEFPETETYFTGEIEEVRFFQRRLGRGEIDVLASGRGSDEKLIARWRFDDAKSGAVADLTGNGHDATIRGGTTAAVSPAPLAVGVSPAVPGAEWLTTGEGDLRLRMPAGEEPLQFTLWLARAEDDPPIEEFVEKVNADNPARHLAPLTEGGPRRWTQDVVTAATLGDDTGPFAVDTLTRPVENPWLARMRLSGLDFFPDGDRAAVCTWDGDVWTVSGLSDLPEALTSDAVEESTELTWQRVASGLFQPLGLKIIDGRIHVTCRDQIAILHDLNGDGEADFIENFNNDHQVTEHFHEFATGLQTDDDGNLYYAKAARHALPAVVPHHGTLLRVAPDGGETEILATGFRAPNGVCVNGDGTFVLTDQEGHWTPKNRINWVREGGFYGNMWGYHDVTDTSDDAMQPPLCWITNEFDRSPAEPLWVDSDAWGPLKGALLNLSYGYGTVQVVLHERAGGIMQGGVCELPIPRLPTGIMRGRFHSTDGQLYTCGLFAWAGSRQQPGGFYRIRYTGRPLHLPIAMDARPDGIAITFTEALAEQPARDAENYTVQAWSLKRSAQYGSEHHNQRQWQVAETQLSPDGRTVVLEIPDIRPTDGIAITYTLTAADGTPVEGEIHGTIHSVRE